MQDSRGVYWFGSWGEGVYQYDGKNIIRYCLGDPLCHDSIVQIQEDKLGNLYFNTRGGITKYDGQTFTSLRVGDYLKNEWRLSPDDMWFKGAQDSGCVYRYDGTTLHRLTFPKTIAGETHIANFPRSAFPNMKFNPYDVYTIYEDTKSNLWFGTGTLGACRYDGNTFSWISPPECGHAELNFGIRSILEDRDGKFWFSKSMYRYDFYSDDVRNENVNWYKRESGIGHPDAHDEEDFIYFLSSVLNRNGDMWMALYRGGVYKYDGKNLTHYPVRDGGKEINVFSIIEDQEGVLWLGTHEAGVYKFNGNEFVRFLPDHKSE